jgi:hypothetical protein
MKRKNQKDYKATRDAIMRAADAVLFRAAPKLSKRKTEDRFVLQHVLHPLVWKYSEATRLGHRKYESCEWWSKKALAAYNADRRGYKKLVALEHVKPRQVLVDELIASRSKKEAHRIFESIITCVVLRSEHKKLRTPKNWKPTKTYWERYRGLVNRTEGPRVAERG